MSEQPILEYWPEGITAARIPANNNVRLIQALLLNPAISSTTAAQPGSPAEGDVYILPASPTGSNWASFFEGDVVIYYSATWTAYAPAEGLRKFVEDEGEDWQFVGDSNGGWAPAGGGGGSVNWGSIGGTLAAQSDLAAALAAKANTSSLAAIATSGALLDATDFPGGTTDFLRADGSFATPAGGGGGLTDWAEAVDASGVNVTVPAVSFTAVNAATDVDATIRPKGNGAFQLSVPDGTTAGGNKRGGLSIDLQRQRASSAQVASGSQSLVAGSNNRASGNISIAIGDANIASAANTFAAGIGSSATAAGAIAVGAVAVASGVDSFSTGGTASGVNSISEGVGGNTRGQAGMRSTAAIDPLRPNNKMTLQGSTSNTTPKVISSNGGPASSTNQFAMSTNNNHCCIVSGLVVARQTGSGNPAMAWEFKAMVDRDGGTTSLIGTVTPTVLYTKGSPSGWAVAVGVGLDALEVTVTGASGVTINWTCELYATETPG